MDEKLRKIILDAVIVAISLLVVALQDVGRRAFLRVIINKESIIIYHSICKNYTLRFILS